MPVAVPELLETSVLVDSADDVGVEGRLEGVEISTVEVPPGWLVCAGWNWARGVREAIFVWLVEQAAINIPIMAIANNFFIRKLLLFICWMPSYSMGPMTDPTDRPLGKK